MGLEKGIEQLAQIFEKEGGINGAKSEPGKDVTKRPISDLKTNQILNYFNEQLPKVTIPQPEAGLG